MNEDLYSSAVVLGNMSPFQRVGSLAQEVITVPIAAILLVLTIVFFRRRRYKVFIAMLGLIANLFYGYALYAADHYNC